MLPATMASTLSRPGRSRSTCRRSSQRLTKQYALQPSQRPNLLVRVVADFWPFEKGCSAAPASVVGVDLLDSDDSVGPSTFVPKSIA